MVMLIKRQIIMTGIAGGLLSADQGIAARNYPVPGALPGRVPVAARA